MQVLLPASLALLVVLFSRAVVGLFYRSRFHQPGFNSIFRPLSLFGSLFPRSPIYNLKSVGLWREKFDIYAKYNSTVLSIHSVFPSKTTILVAEPDACGAILSSKHFVKPVDTVKLFPWWTSSVTQSEGADWERYHRLVGPIFDDSIVTRVWNATSEACREWFKDLDSSASGEGVAEDEVTGRTKKLSCLILPQVLLGASFFEQAGKDSASRHSMTFTEALVGTLDNIIFKALPSWLLYLPFTRLTRARHYFKECDNYLVESVKEAKGRLNKKYAIDFLAQGYEVDQEDTLSNDEVCTTLLTFFSAGYHFAANSISVALTFLALHPEHQEVILREVEALMSPEGDLEADKLDQLVYTRAVYHESLRLFPPLSAIPRIATSHQCVQARNPVLKSSEALSTFSFFIRKNTSVKLCPTGVHYNPSFYPEPYKFDPTRFLEDEDSTWDRRTFLSFSTGPRSCPARKVVEAQAVLLIAMTVHRYNISIPEEYKRMPGESLRSQRERILKVKSGAAVTPTNINLEFRLRR